MVFIFFFFFNMLLFPGSLLTHDLAPPHNTCLFLRNNSSPPLLTDGPEDSAFWVLGMPHPVLPPGSRALHMSLLVCSWYKTRLVGAWLRIELDDRTVEIHEGYSLPNRAVGLGCDGGWAPWLSYRQGQDDAWML